MLSKASTTLGLSSASIAASESEFSMSSSSKSPSFGGVSPPSASSPLARSDAGLNGVALAGAAGGAGVCARPPFKEFQLGTLRARASLKSHGLLLAALLG